MSKEKREEFTKNVKVLRRCQEKILSLRLHTKSSTKSALAHDECFRIVKSGKFKEILRSKSRSRFTPFI